MRRQTSRRIILGIGLALGLGLAGPALGDGPDPIAVDLAGFTPGGDGVAVRKDDHGLTLEWPMGSGEVGRLAVDLRPGKPLFAGMGLADGAGGPASIVLKDVDPATFVTVGTRVGEPNGPPGRSPFVTFFDSPANRPHRSYQAALDLKRARLAGNASRATLTLGEVAAGPFAGELQVSVYAGARLVHVETVVKTMQDSTAFLYDTGLASASPNWGTMVWIGAGSNYRRQGAWPGDDRSVRVRHRAVAAESGGGAVACFPPPHQFFFPRDYTDNLATAWFGRDHRGQEPRPGFGIRQAEAGGGNFSPWYNAPPGTDQRLGVFYLLSRGSGEDALGHALAYTNKDRFPDLPGFKTFTSHWHMALTVAAIEATRHAGNSAVPEAVGMLKAMNVNMVHLAEFHGDGHPADPGPVRLAELAAMFDECRRISDDSITFFPGEEANVHLGPADPKVPDGHWLYLFPRPVAWTMKRAPGQPFAEPIPGGGAVYHVGSADDMARLLDAERGLAWTAHARIKSSSWAPDAYKEEPFFKSDRWLGAAWKAMPGDLSRPKLGTRTLDLLDEMSNWGDRKQLVGEVDVFKIDPSHEVYGHMNINYVRLDKVPAFGDDWSPLLDALRAGRFFVSTGEVLLPGFTLGGKSSGEALALDAEGRPEATLSLRWTFPMRYAELVSGDGVKVYRDRVDLGDTRPFGGRTITLTPDLRGRRWARVEAWDVAANGAFSQPIWLTPGPSKPAD